MNSGSYKIVISISHHRVAFEYWQRDGENKLMPIARKKWPVPLAFYCSPLGIEIGEVAVRAANAGTTNAFNDYFDRLASNETYLLGGQHKPLRYLLLDAAEAMFEEFFKVDLYGHKGTLSDNRATMPLTLVCESDIESSQRGLLASLFRDSGYNRFKLEEYNRYVEDYLRSSLANEYPGCRRALAVWTEGSDLTFTLFDLKGNEERRHVVFPRLGADPRLDYVKQKIWQRINGQNPWLAYEEEEEAIENVAASFLASSDPLLNDTLRLSDGNTYHYSLNRAEIDNLQCDEGVEIRKRLESFLKECGAENRNDILLILRGMASGNVFFEQTICPGFTSVKRSDRKLRDSVMQLLIADPNPHVQPEEIIQPVSPHPEPIPEPIPEPVSEPVATSRTTPTPPPFNPIPGPAVVRRLNREWREVRAEVKGKITVGKKSDAIALLNDFIAKIKTENVKNLLEEANSELEALKAIPDAEKPQVKSENEKKSVRSSAGRERGKDGAGCRPDSSDGSRVKCRPHPNPDVAEEKKDVGKELIAANKLRDARDWYRAQGRNATVKLISDVIRAQKSVDMRRTQIDNYRKDADAVKVGRVIAEIEEFIALCRQIDYPTDLYRQLLSDYKKIKTK